jgi:hypothetical protein
LRPLAARRKTALGRRSASWRLILSPNGIALSGPEHTPCYYPAAGLSWAQSIELALSHLPVQSRPGKLEIILAGVWGRCLLSPPINQLPNAGDMAELARQTIADTYGPQAVHWRMAVQIQGPARPLVVSAVEPGWMDALEQLAASRKLSLLGVEALLAACWNQTCRTLPSKANWFALLEPARIQLIGLQHGHWMSLASTRGEAEGPALRTLLQREAVLAGRPGDEGEAWIYPAHRTPPESRHWRWRLLTPQPALPYGRLLSGA